MLTDDVLSFDEHRRRLTESANTVRCAKCGEWILATAIRCPQCGVHFQGEAQDFVHRSGQSPRRLKLPVWVIIAAIVVVIAMILNVAR